MIKMSSEDIHRGLVNVVVDETSISGTDLSNKNLFYRGYNVKTLSKKCNFLEVAFLFLKGKLPNGKEFEEFKLREKKERKISPDVEKIILNYAKRIKAANIISACLLLEFEEHSKENYYNGNNKNQNIETIILRLISRLPLIISGITQSRKNNKIQEKTLNSEYLGSFLKNNFIYGNQKIVDYLNRLMICAADNGFTASTFMARGALSSGSSVCDSIIAALSSFKGHAHGGASKDVLEMMRILRNFNNKNDIDQWVEIQLAQKKKIPGFGHRLYKKGDPRLKCLSYGFELLDDKERFIIKNLIVSLKERKNILSNPEIIIGPSLSKMGFEDDIIPMVVFLARIAGLGAHLKEQIIDNKIIRPSAIYSGGYGKKFISLEKRK